MFAFDSDSKFFLFFLLYLRTAFYFLLFFLFFLDLFFIIFPFFYLSYSLCLLEPAIHRICHHLLEGLFSFCAVVPIFITLLGMRQNFKARTTALYTFDFFHFS